MTMTVSGNWPKVSAGRTVDRCCRAAGGGGGRNGGAYDVGVSGDQMLAAVYVARGEMDVRRVPVPTVGPGTVLVEVSHCGICGTDLHLVLEGYARPDSILGHEWAGSIAAVGEGVTGWSVGDRVVANPEPGCGTCRACRAGRPSVCLRRPPVDHLEFRGAFCRYVTVDAARLLRIPESLSTRVAALTEPTAIAIHTVNLSGVTPDRSRARDRCRAGGVADHRRLAIPGRRRHHGVRTGRGPAGSSARGRGVECDRP